LLIPLLLGDGRGDVGRRGAGQHPLAGAPVEHGLDVLPGVRDVVGRHPGQLHVAPPRVEVGRVRLHVLGVGQPVRVENELVWREEQVAVGAFDALGSGRVVPVANRRGCIRLKNQKLQ